MSAHRLADAALRCYPAWWRELYAQDAGQLTDDLVADGRSELRLAANLLGGAIMARTWAHGMPLRRDLWAKRTRLSIAVATLPWLAALPFILAGVEVPTRLKTFAGRADASLVGSASTHVLTIAYEVILVGILVSLVTGLVGWSAMRMGVRGLPTATRRSNVLSNVPLLVLGVLAGLHEARQTQLPVASWRYIARASRPPGHVFVMSGDATIAHVLLVCEWVVLFVGAAVSVAALATVAKRCEVWLPAITSGRRVASFISVEVSLMALCAIGGAVASAFHGVTLGSVDFSGIPVTSPGARAFGVKMAVVTPHWALLAVVLGVTATVSFAGWISSRQAARTLHRLTTWY